MLELHSADPAANFHPQFCCCAHLAIYPGMERFLFSVILTQPQNWTVTVALNNISGGQIIPWNLQNLQMAASLLGAMHTRLVYIFPGRYFLRGMMAGSLKD